MRSGIQALRDLAVRDPMVLVTPLLVFVGAMVIGYLVRGAILRALNAWRKRSNSPASRILSEALRGPMVIWVLILAVHFTIEFSGLPPRVTEWTPEVLRLLFIFSLTIMSMRVAGDLVRVHGSQIPGAVPVTTLTQTLAQLTVLIIGGLIILNQLNISITPILTALGVGGLAVALALQDTLSNLFGGFYVAVAGQVRLGDYIKMDSGSEGYVADISWRSTTIRTLGNNMVIVPNSKLAQAIVTNYHLPEKRMTLQVPVGVSYDSDPRHVEKVLLEIATTGASQIAGMLAEPAPTVTFEPGFGDSSLGLTLNVPVAEFSDQFRVRNELRKRIFERFRREEIEMPFPTRTIFVHKAQDAATKAIERSTGASRDGA